MKNLLLIKYGELTTKKGNRNLFIRTLKRNINRVLEGEVYKLTSLYDKMYIESNNLEIILNKVKNVFGINKLMIVNRVESNELSINDCVINLLKDIKVDTFKVITKRINKNYPKTSMEFSRDLGSVLLDNYSFKVDVKNPSLIVNVEINADYTDIYIDHEPGIGGYPVGVLGKGLLMLSGGIDSPVAGYLALKRGIDLTCIYFDSPPHTSVQAKNKVLELANKLNSYSGNIKLLVVPFTKIQETIYKNVKDTYNITIMRRMMYRICDKIVKTSKLKALINGENVGQVASQTLSSIEVINEVTNIPVIRPVVCMDKQEIIELAKKIDTYNTSILPYEDCCTIFVPKHPVINPILEECLKQEGFDYESLIEEAISNIEVITDFNILDNSLL